MIITEIKIDGGKHTVIVDTGDNVIVFEIDPEEDKEELNKQ